MEDNLNFVQIEDDLNILANGRLPQYFGKWKTTSIVWQMEDDLNSLANGRHLNILANGRRPQ
jgi:hypothetical protein